MAILLAFAFLSGIVTILSPCILPLLPVVLSGTAGGGKARPYGILFGFVVSFTALTLTLSALVRATGISVDALRIAAVIVIALFALVLLVPQFAVVFERLAHRVAAWGGRITDPAQKKERKQDKAGGPPAGGFPSGIPVGFSLGLIWTPCVGPIMASVISLAITQAVDGGALFITLAYTLGTSIPMLAVMLGGRALLNRVPFLSRNSAKIQRLFGALMLVTAIAVGLGWDRRFQSAVLDVFPNYGSGLTAVEENKAVRRALEERDSAGVDEGGGWRDGR